MVIVKTGTIIWQPRGRAINIMAGNNCAALNNTKFSIMIDRYCYQKLTPLTFCLYWYWYLFSCRFHKILSPF